MFVIFVNFNTGYYSKGTIIKNKDKISRKYKKEYFVYDILVLVSIIYYIFAKKMSLYFHF